MANEALRALRDVGVVAGHELAEALRSKRVLILALLYVGGAVAGTLGFVELLDSLEQSLSQALSVAQADRPGAFTAELMRSEEFVKVLTRLIKDEALARELAGLPPLSLFYGWLAFTFCPVLVMLTATEAITQDLASGAARFSLVRTDRLSFGGGKLVGQRAGRAVSVFAGALGVWATGYFSFAGFAAGESALWLLRLSARATVYCFAHVGIALGLSQLTRSIPLARALGLLGLALLGALWGISHMSWVQEQAGSTVRVLLPLLPRAHQLELWRPTLQQRLPALVMLVALGLLYFAAGHRYRARRDT